MIGYVPTVLRAPSCGSQPCLAHFHTKWGFSIKKTKWDLFIEGHRFSSRHCMGTFEIDSKTIDLNLFINGVSPVHRVMRQIIRIGIINDYSPRKIEMQKDSDGRMMVISPRLNELLLRQRSLRKLMDPFLWNYVLEKELEEELLPMPNSRNGATRTDSLSPQRHSWRP